jgi:hypothetical protein
MMAMLVAVVTPARNRLSSAIVIGGLFCVRSLWLFYPMRRSFVVVGIDLSLRVGVIAAA